MLIDTGAATGLKPSLGWFPAALAAAGVDPASIDTVAMTHLHADHVNGLVTSDGHPAFPNAELLLHAAERAFWTDDGARSRARAASQVARHIRNAPASGAALLPLFYPTCS